jgi:hypothetical protein
MCAKTITTQSLQPGEECGVTRGRSRYYREPPAPAGGEKSLNKYFTLSFWSKGCESLPLIHY